MPVHQKKRKFEMGRQAASTKIGSKRVIEVRGRGGNMKYRALALDSGNFAWQSEAIARKTRVIDTAYNATNNEFTRTKTLVKNSIVQIDTTPFKQWYLQHYGVDISGKGEEQAAKSKSVLKKQQGRERIVDENVLAQFKSGRVLACISSRPGQTGRADGYILEGKELEFYLRKMDKKNKKK